MAILESSVKHVTASAPLTSSQFNIEASPEAFEILSDRIYPNKIRAVIRELSTNAVDATIDAAKVKRVHELVKQGKLKPAALQWQIVSDDEGKAHTQYIFPEFDADILSYVGDGSRYIHKELDIMYSHPSYDLSAWEIKRPVVHMPNRLEPHFSVRDFGTGLSHEKIMKMYTTYFHSDKNTSNDYTGCLGLGSKSPFAYTDHFTVISHWNGEKRTYMAVLKEGFPHISIFKDGEGKEMVEPTTEPNGLQVQFAVKTHDIYEFDNEALRLYPFFKMSPTIVGNSSIKAKLEDIAKRKAEGTYYVFHDDKIGFGIRQSDSRGPLAIMGSIAYPIKLDNVPEGDNYNIMRAILGANVDIHFPIGDLQIAPSREQLSYKASTTKNIQDKLGTIAEQLTELVKKKVEDMPTLWDARVSFRQLFNDTSIQSIVNSVNTGKLTWKGIPVGGEVNLSYDKTVKTKATNPADGTEFEVETRIPESDYPWVLTSYSRPRGKGVNLVGQVINAISPSKNLNLYEIDVPRGVVSRVNYHYRNTGNTIMTVSFKDKASRAEFIDRLGMKADAVFPLLSSLPVPPQAERVSYGNISQVFVYNEQRRSKANYASWEMPPSDFKIDDGGVYVEMIRYKVIGEKQEEIHAGHLRDTIRTISAVSGVPLAPVIGVRNKVVKLFRRSDDWVSIWEYARNILKQADTKDDLSQHVANLTEFNQIQRHDFYLEMAGFLTTTTVKIDENNDFVKFLRQIAELGAYESNESKATSFKNLAMKVGYKNDKEPKHKIAGTEDTVIDKYPMLKYAISSGWGSQELTDSCLKYVQLIDKTPVI